MPNSDGVRRYGLEAAHVDRPFSWQTECMTARLQRDSEPLSLDVRGWYVYASGTLIAGSREYRESNATFGPGGPPAVPVLTRESGRLVATGLTGATQEIRIVLINSDLEPDKEDFPVTVLCALLLILAGAALIYLASARQRLRTAFLPLSARVAGWLLVFAGTATWLSAAGVGAGMAGALTTLMLAWVLLPYLAWWRIANAPADKP